MFRPLQLLDSVVWPRSTTRSECCIHSLSCLWTNDDVAAPAQTTPHLHLSPQFVAVQAGRPTIVLNMRFLKGSITFIGLSLQAAESQAAAAPAAAAIGMMSQQAGLLEKLQRVLSQQGVYLPRGVSAELACSPQFFALAQQHGVCAGLWVRNANLRVFLQLFMA